MKKYLVILAVGLLSACTSQIKFNEKYTGAEWNKILIAPIDGDDGRVVSDALDQEFSTDSGIQFIPANKVALLLQQHNLEKDYKSSPKGALLSLAKIIHADGIIEGEVESRSANRYSASNEAVVLLRLFDINTLAVVTNSRHDSTSLFSSPRVLTQALSVEAVADMRQAVNQLNK